MEPTTLLTDSELAELAPFMRKIATEMGREAGAQMLRPEFLGGLAARATLAAAAFVGNPLADAPPVEQRLRAFIAELEMAGSAEQAPLPTDLLIAALRHRVLEPHTPDGTGPEKAADHG